MRIRGGRCRVKEDGREKMGNLCGLGKYLPTSHVCTANKPSTVVFPMQVSFVNSICTTKGGTHVNYIVDQVTKWVEMWRKGQGPG